VFRALKGAERALPSHLQKFRNSKRQSFTNSLLVIKTPKMRALSINVQCDEE